MLHETLIRAITDSVWVAVMIDFNLLDQNARQTALESAIARTAEQDRNQQWRNRRDATSVMPFKQ